MSTPGKRTPDMRDSDTRHSDKRNPDKRQARAARRLVGGADGVSPWWFLVLTLAGFTAATAAAAGPGLAIRRLQPRGPALRLAATAGGVAAAAGVVAAAAIIVAVTGLVLWAPGFAGYHHAAIPDLYLALVVVAAAVTAVSAARGTRAALPEPEG